MLYVLAIVILLLVGLVKYSLARLTYPETWTRHDHSGPKTYPHVDPFLGLDLAIQTWQEFNRGELSEGLRRRHLVHGPTYITRNLGSDCIYTIEPDNIRTITTRDFDKYGKSGWVEEAAKHVGNGILMNEGEAWKHSRVMLKPIFSRSVMSEPMLLEPHVRSLVDSMRHSSAQGNGVFDFHELASMFTLDVVTEFLFGKSTDCLENPRGPDGQDGVHFLSLVKEFEGPSGKFIAIGPLAWLGLLPKYRRLIGLVEGMKAFFRRKLCEIVIEANNCPFVPIRGMPRLLEVSPSVFRSMKRAGVSDDRIQGELRNIFFASYDTTSTFLANLVYVLVRHPDVQQRLRQEIASLEGRLPSQRDLGKMGYVRLVIMEALRLYSPVSSHSRTAKVDTTLPRGSGSDAQSPLFVRAGTTIVWSTYSLNRDPRKYGKDWAQFRPDRWTTLLMPKDTTSAAVEITSGTDGMDSGDKKGGTADDTKIGEDENWRAFFMPFGNGPRSCLGQQMVQTEVAYVLVRLLQEFSVITMDDADAARPFKEARAVSFYNDGGIHIRVN